MGLTEAAAFSDVLRLRQTVTVFLACCAGRGRLLVDGVWHECGPGTACLLPAHAKASLQTIPKTEWELCWVCYLQSPGPGQISNHCASVVGQYNHAPLQSAILGLIHECQSRAAPAFLQRWVELIHEYVLRFARRVPADRRLCNLWDRVATELDGNWSLARLAREAGYSSEHLRRLCHIEIGRSPMHQVIHLRMHRAAELLAHTRETIGTIAREVGYEDPFVFSKAFHRWIGWTPSEYRGHPLLEPDGPAVEPQPVRPATRNQSRGRRLVSAALFVALTLQATGGPLVQSDAPNGVSPSTRNSFYGGEPSGPSRTLGGIGDAAAQGEQQDRALREEQLSAARELASELPDSLDAMYIAGYVSNEQGDSVSAIRQWEEAIHSEPGRRSLYDRATVYYSLGYALLLREDYQKAVSMLQEAVRLNPRQPEAHFRLAHAFFLQGSMEECLRALDEGKVETPLAYRLRGQVNQHLGKLAEAKSNYQMAVRLNPGLAEAYYGLATTCARLGEMEKSDEYRRAFDALKSKGQALGRQARTDFDPLTITRRSLAQTHSEIGRVYLDTGRTQKAENLLRRAAEMDPSNTACRFQLMMLYQRAQRNQEALQLSKEMIKADPQNPFHYLAAGNLHLRLRQSAEAEIAFKRVIELAPGRAEGYFALAQIYVQSKTNRDDALRLARRTVSLAPSAVNYYVLAQACAMNEDLSGALASIDKACELDPQSSQYQEWRASIRKQQRR